MSPRALLRRPWCVAQLDDTRVGRGTFIPWRVPVENNNTNVYTWLHSKVYKNILHYNQTVSVGELSAPAVCSAHQFLGSHVHKQIVKIVKNYKDFTIKNCKMGMQTHGRNDATTGLKSMIYFLASTLTRLTWLIHISVLPSNWNLGKNFALTC